MGVALEIVSPEKLLLSQDVGMVVLPAAEGDLGVLPGHAPMIVSLRGGVISIYEDGKNVSARLFVAGGFAEITDTRCTILADEAVAVAELSRAAAQTRLAEAETIWQATDKMDIAAIDDAQDRLYAARAMIDAAQAA
jgi:F-type H+-transporting ATPase subunit epsilon